MHNLYIQLWIICGTTMLSLIESLLFCMLLGLALYIIDYKDKTNRR